MVPVVQPETYGDHVGQDVKFDDDDGSSPSVTGIAAGILWADFLFLLVVVVAAVVLVILVFSCYYCYHCPHYDYHLSLSFVIIIIVICHYHCHYYDHHHYCLHKLNDHDDVVVIIFCDSEFRTIGEKTERREGHKGSVDLQWFQSCPKHCVMSKNGLV